MDYVNKVLHGDWVEVAKSLPDASVHTIITSPPYWGQRNYGVEGQLGLEKTPEDHIEKLVAGFRELWRILRLGTQRRIPATASSIENQGRRTWYEHPRNRSRPTTSIPVTPPKITPPYIPANNHFLQPVP